jgi:outer membrane phospholipase A
MTASAPAGPVAVGADVPVELYVLNTGAAPAPVDLPATLPCRLISGGRTFDASLRRTSPAPAAAEIAPGTFARATYIFTLPEGAGGAIVLELDRPGLPRTALTVAAPPGAATAPAPTPGDAEAVARNEPVTPTAKRGESGIAQYVPGRFTGHEPMYFLVGPDAPNAKFQISFKYQILNPEGPLVKRVPSLGGLHVAYSQTSFWDLEGDSKPFFDNSYRPELLWSADDLRLQSTPSVISRLGLQAGLQHESNGQSGDDSRSLNIAYVRPIFTFGDASNANGLFLTVAPKLFAYIGDIEDNPDIKDYRGNVEIRGVVGWQEGLQLSTIGRIGDDWDKGSVQFDLTYPLRKVFAGNLDVFLHAQYFNGYGESLLEYNESTSAFRLGVSLVR